MTTTSDPGPDVREPVASGDGPRRLALDITGMSCGACAVRVEATLNKLPGVAASVNYATRVASVSAPADVEVDALRRAVTDVGYGADLREPGAGGDAARDPDADEARRLMARLAVAAVLFVPLADLSVMFAVVPSTRFAGWQWLLVALAAPVVTWAAWPLHAAALRGARHGVATMDTLISVGVTAATVWSLTTLATVGEMPPAAGVWQALAGSDAIYLEVAAGVTVFVLAGRYFEARARSRAGDALRALAALSAKDVTVLLPDGAELTIPAAELKEQQRFVVRPGQRVAADGLVTEGGAGIDMSAMTGEAAPVRVGPGDTVVGGTVALDGLLVVEAAAVGDETRFAGMVRLVEAAQTHKADAQRVADRIAGVFVPIVFVLAAATLAGWGLSGAPTADAFAAALAVLVIACPCALGLATPMAMMVASGRGAQLGIFLKGHRALEVSRAVDTVVFDKTGTLTTGRLAVTGVAARDGHTRGDVLATAAAIEAGSEHPVGIALAATRSDVASTSTATATDVGAGAPTVTDFRADAGAGVSGVVDGRTVRVGRPSWVSGNDGVADHGLAAFRRDGERRGETVVFVEIDGQVCGAVSVADTVKTSAADAVATLQRRGLRTVLLTGDNAGTAAAVAAQVGIDEVFAEVPPEGKVDVVERLREAGRVVAMVGDGINDAPALATADLGLAIGRGTDVAIGAADIILVRHDLDVVPQALALATATMRTVRTNMVWAFGYNVAALPLAAAGLLNPLIAGAAMALSSFFVVSNSLRLRRAGGPSPAQRRDLDSSRSIAL